MKRPSAKLILILTAALAMLSLCASSNDQRACDGLMIYRPAFVRVAEVALDVQELTEEDIQRIIASDKKVNPIQGRAKTIGNHSLGKRFESSLKNVDDADWQHIRFHLATMLARRANAVDARKIARETSADTFIIKKVAEFDFVNKKAVQLLKSKNGKTYFSYQMRSGRYQVSEVDSAKPVWTSEKQLSHFLNFILRDNDMGHPQLEIVHQSNGDKKVSISTTDIATGASTERLIPGQFSKFVDRHYVLRNGDEYIRMTDPENGVSLIDLNGKVLNLDLSTISHHHMAVGPSGETLVASFGNGIQVREVNKGEFGKTVYQLDNVHSNFSRFFTTDTSNVFIAYETESDSVVENVFDPAFPAAKLPRPYGNSSYHEFPNGRMIAAQVSGLDGNRKLEIFDLRRANKALHTHVFDGDRKKFALGWISNFLGDLLFVATNMEVLVYRFKDDDAELIASMPFSSMNGVQDILMVFNSHESIYLLASVNPGHIALHKLLSPEDVRE